MSDPHRYLLMAYVVSFAVLWGYAAVLWWSDRRLSRRERGMPRRSDHTAAGGDRMS